MAIQWFPGHMNKARREIRAAMPKVDLVIEVLDARIPSSSENPLVAELRGGKPSLRILNKADLADPARTERWLAHLASSSELRAIPHAQGQGNLLATVTRLAQELVPPVRSRAMVAMIVGVPNVGKSTIINTLAGKHMARAENRPAITQAQQRVQVHRDLALLDTPGFLWPKLTPPECGYRLALTGAVADRVTDPIEIAVFGARALRERYPAALQRVYGLAELAEDPLVLVESVGRSRGFLVRGGGVDLRRAAERLIHDLRAGVLGPVTLEDP